jgi:hypothetical protein
VIPALPSPWPRERFVAGGDQARLAYVALLPEAVELAKQSHPLFAGFEFAVHYRGDDPAWFDGWVDPRSSFGSLLLRTPGVDMAGLAACKAAVVITGSFDDPRDLGYLQRAFLVLKLLAKAGAVAICDVDAMIWWTRESLEELPNDWELDVADHLRIVFEPTEREPGAGHLCHTLGMAKFGRPDLAIGGLDREHAQDAGGMLMDLATALAQGERFEDGDVIEPQGFPPLRCQAAADDSGTQEVLFGNTSIWLVPEV